MIVFIALACVAARVRGYRVAAIWRDASLYPLYALECVYWVFQISAFRGNFAFLPYAPYLQSAFLLATLAPVLRHRLYARAAAGTGMVLAGTALNRLVIAANGGRMPVYPTVSRLTGYFDLGALADGADPVHTLMTSRTALNFLGDYFDVGFSIMSPGDLLIHGFIAVVVYGAIKSAGKRVYGG